MIDYVDCMEAKLGSEIAVRYGMGVHMGRVATEGAGRSGATLYGGAGR